MSSLAVPQDQTLAVLIFCLKVINYIAGYLLCSDNLLFIISEVFGVSSELIFIE